MGEVTIEKEGGQEAVDGQAKGEVDAYVVCTAGCGTGEVHGCYTHWNQRQTGADHGMAMGGGSGDCESETEVWANEEVCGSDCCVGGDLPTWRRKPEGKVVT